jgi:hypothetical protein
LCVCAGSGTVPDTGDPAVREAELPSPCREQWAAKAIDKLTRKKVPDL